MSNDNAWAMPIAELERRRDGVLNWMSANNVSVVIITDPESLVYLTGIDLGGRPRGKAMLLAESGKHFFVTRSLERHWQPHWVERTWCTNWEFHEDSESLAEALARLAPSLCGGRRPERIGLELTRPSLSFTDAQMLAASADSVIDATAAVTSLRRIKSEWERRAMRRAGEISMLGVAAAIEVIKGGGRGSDATAAAFAALIGAEGGQSPVSGPHVTSGPRTAMAHSAWNHEIPAMGDSVVVVMTGTCERYNAPIEWTFTRGEPDQAKVKMLETCMQASDAIMAGLRPGMTSHEGDLICREIIEEAGLAQHFMNRAAYGIGLSFGSWMESLVQLKPNDHSPIEPGMTMHLVPALHAPGYGFMIRTVAFEVTETGCQSLRPPVSFETAI
ncbi:MAG: aminopeptidase family protein [Microvirga sp.]|jgi:Xaa-Pro dipeptidase|nr:aminopeptidase family protein [Microvirga sp.]